MEELLFEYEQNILSGTNTEESNGRFIRSFVDIIIRTSQDIREEVYREALRALLIFEYRQWKQTKNFDVYYYIHCAVFAIVVGLNRNGVILSAKSYNSISKQFGSEESRKLINSVYELLLEKWEESTDIVSNTPHVTDELLSYLSKEDATLFIEDVKTEKKKHSKREKANVFHAFMSYKPKIKNTPSEIAEVLHKSTLIEYSKEDIRQYTDFTNYKKLN